jgi:CDP-glycerol glycerophosphotransferase
VYRDLAECPDLLFDSLVVTKAYRRDLVERAGLRFVEGMLYEDLPFTTEAYLAADSIAMLPVTVYRWHVAPPEQGGSITQRRHEVENLESRLRALDLVDGLLAAPGHEVARRAAWVKALKHDYALYLDDMLDADDALRAEVLGIIGSRVRAMDPTALDALDDVQRAAYALVMAGDVEGAMGAVAFWRRDALLAAPLAVRDGRTFWGDRHLDDPGMRALLDVSGRQLSRVPWVRRHLCHHLVAAGPSDGGAAFVLRGTTVDPFGDMGETPALSLVVRRRGGGDRSYPCDVERDGPHALRWTAMLPADLDVVVGRSPWQLWDFYLDAQGPAGTNRSVLLVGRDVGPVPVAFRPPMPWLLGDRLQFWRRGNDGLAARLAYSTPTRQAAGARLVGLAQAAPVRQGRRVWRLAERDLARPTAARLMRLGPVDPDRVVFESHLGRQFSDGPKYVYEELRRRRPDMTFVWAYSSTPAGFPADVVRVKRGSYAYLRELARAGWWVDNQGFPRELTPRPGQTYLQTWHGIPLKRMGFDEPRFREAPDEQRAEIQAMVDRWDYLVSPGPFFDETFLPAFRYEGEVIRYGSPRNDRLVTESSSGQVAALRRRLDLPDDRTIVLYAPTFREGARSSRGPVPLALELSVMQQVLGESAYLLLRPHYLNTIEVPRRFDGFARDVTSHPDVTDLMLAADVLVTDYSSVMFDYAVLDRPMVFFTYDYDEYVRDTRGTYVELRDIAPGPLVQTTSEVAAELADLPSLDGPWRDRRLAFLERYGPREDGHAAERVVDRVFGDAAPRRGGGAP